MGQEQASTTERTKFLERAIMILTFRSRIYPSKSQGKILGWILDQQTELYNSARELYIDYLDKNRQKSNKRFPNFSGELTKARKEIDELKDLPVSMQRWTLCRVDSNFRSYFAKRKNDLKARFPRKREKLNTFGFNYMNGVLVRKDRVRLFINQKHICLRFKPRRKIDYDRIKNCTFSKRGSKWYVHLNIHVDDKQKIEPKDTSKRIGIDLNIENLLTTSDNERIENPRLYKKFEDKIGKIPQSMSGKTKDSRSYNKERIKLNKIYTKIYNSRETLPERHLVIKYQECWSTSMI